MRCVVLLCILASSLTGWAEELIVQESLAEQQYQKALELRERDGASKKQLAQAASLLKAAAGLKIQNLNKGSEQDDTGNVLLKDGIYQEIMPGVEVAEETHPAALQLLSELYLLGDEGLPFKPSLSFALMHHAAKLGNPQAQREVGLWLATGTGPPAPGFELSDTFSFQEPDIPRALVYLFQAASQKDSLAQIALGYRHSLGLGVPKSCPIAATYYAAVAEQVVKEIEAKQYDPFTTVTKVSNVPLSSQHDIYIVPRDQQRLHYQWFADLGYVDAQRAMGSLLSQGDAEEARQALKYFRKAAEAGDPDAQAYLGHHYASGVGVPVSNDTALSWFRQGAKGGSSSAQFGLGYMYLHGHGVAKDFRLALTFLKQAAEKGHAEAWFHIGTMHLNGWGVPVSITQAQNYFALSAKMGHILAQYNLAMTLLQNEESCEMGLSRVKDVAENGPWIELLQDANDLYNNGDRSRGDHELALMEYLKFSELGYEVAQVNAAWMISKRFGLPKSTQQAAEGNATSWAILAGIRANQRASQQGNVDAMLAAADTYYYGRGIPSDWPSAFKLYSAAATQGRSAQAYFNLGYMHQMGQGVAFDPALAKRNYDKAVEMQSSAKAPVWIALLSLKVQNWSQKVLPVWVLKALLPHAEESTFAEPAGSYLPKFGFNLGILDSILDVEVWDPVGIWTVKYKAWESYVLLILSFALVCVLFRRHQIRAGPPRTIQQRQQRVGVAEQRPAPQSNVDSQRGTVGTGSLPANQLSPGSPSGPSQPGENGLQETAGGGEARPAPADTSQLQDQGSLNEGKEEEVAGSEASRKSEGTSKDGRGTAEEKFDKDRGNSPQQDAEPRESPS